MKNSKIQQIKKRDGRIVPFDQERITVAVHKAIAATGEEDGVVAKRISNKVVKILNERFQKRIPGVEDIQDIVIETLQAEGFKNVADAYAAYRQKRTEIRELKYFLLTKDVKMKLTPNALKVLESRYLRKDINGKLIETPSDLFKRVAQNIAAAEKIYNPNITDDELFKTEERFYRMMALLEFLPNSPTLMNAGSVLQQLSACFVIPVEDSITSIFGAIRDTALIHQCLTRDNWVMTSEGLCKINKVKPGTKIMTDEGEMLVSRVYNNGPQKTYEVNTEHGFAICGTDKHKLLIVDEQGKYVWKEIKNLRGNDWLVLKPSIWLGRNNSLPRFDYQPKLGGNRTSFKAKIYDLPTTLSVELAEILGLYMGDGSNHRDGIRFSIGDDSKDLIKKLQENVFKVFGKENVVLSSKIGNYEVSILSIQIREWFSFLGFKKKSSLKAFIPKAILGASEEIICGFLRGLFTADACVRKSGHITLSTASFRFSKQIQNALMYLGIPTRRTYYRRSFDKHSELRDIYQISICTKDGFQLFKEKIGFLSANKQERLNQVNPDCIFKRGEIIPNQRFLLKKWYSSLPVGTKASVQIYYDRIVNRIADPSELTRQKVQTTLEEGMLYPFFFRKLAKDKFLYSRVDSVKYRGVREVFDLTVPFKHAYIANGFVSHNSGGGTGFSFARLRPKGDVVKSTSGVASGPVSFMTVFDKATEVIKQGGKRRGANMGILRVDHPDIMEFITAKRGEGILQNFNISVAITDEFMDAVETGRNYDLINPRNDQAVKQLDAREVLDLIVKLAWETGDPGVVFIDRMNNERGNPTPYLGKIEATNPCVVGDTLVATENGLERMDALYKRFAENGRLTSIVTDDRTIPASVAATVKERVLAGGRYESSFEPFLVSQRKPGATLRPTIMFYDNGKKETLKIVTKAGFELTATLDHKVLTPPGWAALQDLKVGDKIFIQSGAGHFGKNQTLPVKVSGDSLDLPKQWSQELGQALGWLVGDGWMRSGDKNCRAGFVFSPEDKNILDYFKPILNKWYGRDIKEIQRGNGVYHLSYHSKAFVKFFEQLGVKAVKAEDKVVPKSIFTAPKEAVIGFLQGLFSADGTVNFRKNHSSYVRLTSKSNELLKGVQLLLLNLGIFSMVYDRSRAPRVVFSYTTVRGQKKKYHSDGICYELEISRQDVLKFLKEVGFLLMKHNENIQQFSLKTFYERAHETEIKEIRPAGLRTVYDLTEPVTYSFITNGIVSLDCGEQPLLPYESCNLGSINLIKMLKQKGQRWDVDWKHLRETVRDAVHFLDNVVEMNRYPLPEIEAMTRGNRRVGLGVMGWSDMLIRLAIPYNTQQAFQLASKIMKFIDDEADRMSSELAKKRGVFPNFKGSVFDKKGGTRMRNVATTTIAPTGTIGIIAGVSQGIEPIFALVYRRYSFIGKEAEKPVELLEINPLFEEIARKEGFYSDELMQKVALTGSVQGLKEVPLKWQKIFVTAHDIPPEEHVKMQASFQKHVDNAVSKTINFPETATLEDVKKAYLLAYKYGCKGITIYRSGSKQMQILQVGAAPKKEETKLVMEQEISPELKDPEATIPEIPPGSCPTCTI